MSQIPEEWQRIKVSDALAVDGLISDGDWVESKDQDPNGNIRLIQLADIGDGDFRDKSIRYMNLETAKRLNCTFLKKGDVLIARMPDPLGRACIFPGLEQEAVTVVDVCLLRITKNSAFISSLLKYWINSSQVRNEIAMQATGTTRKRITRKKLEAFIFPLPPLAEQKEIARRLDDMLAQVDTLKARLDNIPAILKRFRQSVLAAAVSGKLTKDWRKENECGDPGKRLNTVLEKRKSNWFLLKESEFKIKGKLPKNDQWKEKYPEPFLGYFDPLKRTPISNIPESWIASNLDTVTTLVTGKTPPTTDPNNWSGDLPFISPTQIRPEDYIEEPERFVSKKGAEKVPVLPSGSIVIVCIGTIGKVGQLKKASVINQQINALIPSEFVDAKFLKYWSKVLYSWLISTSTATVNAAILNKSKLSEAPFPLAPLEEQTEIVRRVEQLFAFSEKIEEKVNNAQSRVDKLTQSILKKAFQGDLTAEWRAANPELISGKNSAEALLKRIKAERESMKPVKKSKKKAKA